MKVNLYKRISRLYWERWQWELQQWRQSVMQDRMIRSRAVSSRFQLSHPYVPYLFGGVHSTTAIQDCDAV